MQYNITTRKKDKGIQYIISYKDNTGTWKQKSKQGFAKVGDAKVAALEKARKIEAELELQASVNREHEGKTFKEFKDMYVKHITLYREGNTVTAYSDTFKAFSRLNDLEVCKIESVDIQECVDDMVKSGLAVTTIKSYLSRIRTAFNYAVKPLKMTASNPVSDIDISMEKNKSEKVALTQSQLSDLLSKIKNRKYYLISLIAAKCGLRIGEIIGLTWDDIDDKKCIMNIKQQWKRLKDGAYGFGELKSKNSYRKVPIPSEVMSELEKFKKEYPLNYNKRVLSIKNVNTTCNALKVVYTKAGYDISVHELRHTYATTLVANGADFKTVAYLMGHDVKQTLETYSHVTDDMMKGAIDLINKIL
jgi:integrase